MCPSWCWYDNWCKLAHITSFLATQNYKNINSIQPTCVPCYYKWWPTNQLKKKKELISIWKLNSILNENIEWHCMQIEFNSIQILGIEF